MNIVEQMIAWESGTMDETEAVAFFQELVSSGMAWQLQGVYGRHAVALIEAGLVTPGMARWPGETAKDT